MTLDSASRGALLRRSFRKSYPVAVRGEGVFLWDADGRRYLDFVERNGLMDFGKRLMRRMDLNSPAAYAAIGAAEAVWGAVLLRRAAA